MSFHNSYMYLVRHSVLPPQIVQAILQLTVGGGLSGYSARCLGRLDTKFMLIQRDAP